MGIFTQKTFWAMSATLNTGTHGQHAAAGFYTGIPFTVTLFFLLYTRIGRLSGVSFLPPSLCYRFGDEEDIILDYLGGS